MSDHVSQLTCHLKDPIVPLFIIIIMKDSQSEITDSYPNYMSTTDYI
jgi:hypothetical protein